MTYCSETNRPLEEIQAGLASGTLVKFRRDANGVQWYRELHAIPATPTQEIDAEPSETDPELPTLEALLNERELLVVRLEMLDHRLRARYDAGETLEGDDHE